MDDTAKYLIHAAITADGVVERSDVVGAIFGQTEGLLGDELDLRDLQQSSKVGRIDVEIASENGQSFGEITIASSLDKVETSILAASLETITRVGPCQSNVEITDIEDVRAAKRRSVVNRAKELLADSFDESVMTSREILEEVRESVRIENITDYAGFPAGPHVDTSDAIVVVEGRADVLTLLRYGIKNAVAVEGTNVPDAVAELTQERNVTAFLDGDRGGELILRELSQIGDVDYVAFAPKGRSVEDLARHEVMSALREKVPYETFTSNSGSPSTASEAIAATDGSARPAPEESEDPRTESPETTESPTAPLTEPAGERDVEHGEPIDETDDTSDEDESTADPADTEDAVTDAEAVDSDAEEAAPSLHEHVREVISAETTHARLLDGDGYALAELPTHETFDAIADADVDAVPRVVVLDDELDQRVLDVAAQRGVERIVARSTGEFVKRPVSVRVLTADQLTVE